MSATTSAWQELHDRFQVLRGCLYVALILISVTIWVGYRRRQTVALRALQGQTLLAEIPEPVHLLDKRGQVSFWNLAEQLYGIPAAKMLGRNADDMLGVSIADPGVDQVHKRGYRDSLRWTGEISPGVRRASAAN